MRPQIDFRGQAVSVARTPTPLFVDGDAARLCQVVSNLLTNASKYSPEGARIEVSLRERAGEVEFVVSDEGIGIDPEMMPRLFDDGFLQGDRTLDRSHDGLGIGLTIVRHVVELHGGEVEAQSLGLGKGSQFSVRLKQIAAPPQRLPSDTGEPLRPTPRRVLVVEDSRDTAESLRELLHMSGHEVRAVHSGAQALSLLEEFRADVVLLDIGLPRMDGFMVAHAIRARFAHLPPRPRLFALTGHGREEDRLSALRSGFDGHLTKPVEPTLLLRMVAGEEQSLVMPGELRRRLD